MSFDQFSTIISIVAAIFTAYITSKLTYRHETKRRIHETREITYVEVFKQVDSLQLHPQQVFDRHFIDQLLSNRAKMRMFSSEEVIQEYKKLYDYCTSHWIKYKAFCEKNDPQITMVSTEYDNDGERCEIAHFTEFDLEDFNLAQEAFRQENAPDRKMLATQIEELLVAMRIDLGVERRII